MISSKYQVDFSQYEIDFRELVDKRLLAQFKDSPVIKALIYAFADEAQTLYDCLIDLLKKRTLYDGFGSNLDAIGRIVGQIRENMEVDLVGSKFFTPDSEGLGADAGLVYVTGGQGGSQSIPVYDGDYKNELLGRIMCNINKYSSVPEIQAALKEALGIDVSFVSVENEPFCVDIKVSSALTAFQRGFLTLTHGVEYMEKMYFAPYPATLRIRNVIELQSGVTNQPGINSLRFGLPQRNKPS